MLVVSCEREKSSPNCWFNVRVGGSWWVGGQGDEHSPATVWKPDTSSHPAGLAAQASLAAAQ